MAQGVKFGDCTIHFSQRTLLRDGEPVSLAPLVFDCIAYLIQHRDRAVGRDELVAAVWGKVSVSDAALGKTILTARRAIGDDGENQRFLRTVPRFGYRWTAQTQVVDGAGESAPASEATAAAENAAHTRSPIAQAPAGAASADTARRFLPATRVLAVAAALVLLLAAFAYFAPWRQAGTAVEPSIAAADRPVGVIAVLPAEVMASSDDAWLRLGLMDIIATRLGTTGLAVLPSDNVVRLVPAGTRRDAALATLRGVTERSRLIAPAVRRSGTDWIVRAELIDAAGQTHAVEAQADNVIAAASIVCDRLRELLAAPAAATLADTAHLSETELLQRIDAARLARQPTEARALIEAAAPSSQQSAQVRLRRAQIDIDLGDSASAEKQLAQLAADVSAEDDPLLHAFAQRSRCVALARLGRADAAAQTCDDAIALLERRNLPGDLARAYNDRGIVHLIREEYAPAGEDFARAKIAANLAVDAVLLAQIEGNESNLQALQGRYAEVVATQQRIGRRFERFGMIDEYVNSLINESTAWVILLHPLEALDASNRALAQLAHVGHAGTRLLIYLERANALELSGRYAEERAMLDRALQESGGDSFAAERGIAHATQARLELATGQTATALLLARQALGELAAPGVNVHRAGAWQTVVRSLDKLQRIDEAATEARAFAAWAATSNDASVALAARLVQAEHAAQEQRPAQARPLFEEALGMAERWSAPDVLREVVGSYGRFLLAQGELEQAGTVIGLVSRYAEFDFESAVLQAELYRALEQEQAASAALAQARRLAGERTLPATLSPGTAQVMPKSSSGNGLETNAQ
jgi:DNA-binding winged helix-turn-helix (wHTH) protein